MPLSHQGLGKWHNQNSQPRLAKWYYIPQGILFNNKSWGKEGKTGYSKWTSLNILFVFVRNRCVWWALLSWMLFVCWWEAANELPDTRILKSSASYWLLLLLLFALLLITLRCCAWEYFDNSHGHEPQLGHSQGIAAVPLSLCSISRKHWTLKSSKASNPMRSTGVCQLADKQL